MCIDEDLGIRKHYLRLLGKTRSALCAHRGSLAGAVLTTEVKKVYLSRGGRTWEVTPKRARRRRLAGVDYLCPYMKNARYRCNGSSVQQHQRPAYSNSLHLQRADNPSHTQIFGRLTTHRTKYRRSIYSSVSRVKSGGGTASLLSVAGLIACKDMSLFEAFSCPWTPSSTFYKLLEIERPLVPMV